MIKKSPMSNRKPRTETLILDMEKQVALNNFTIGNYGSITVGSANGAEQPIAAYLTTSYDREKKPKVINRLIVSPDNLTINQNAALTRYTSLLAIDTNKPEKKLKNTVFSGIVLSQILPLRNGEPSLQVSEEKVIEIHNLQLPSEQSERFGWSLIFKSKNKLFEKGLVAVIVDSHLDHIPFINRREEPILDDFYLPPHFELLYASSDPGDKYFVNILLKICDQNTRKVAKLVASTPSSSLPPLMEAYTGEPYTHYRIWNVPKDLLLNQDQQ
jgi:hypothetical protein